VKIFDRGRNHGQTLMRSIVRHIWPWINWCWNICQ